MAIINHNGRDWGNYYNRGIMKDFLSKTSTTSIVAILLILMSMGILFYVAATDNPKDATTRTQIVQGVIGLLMMVGGYFFGASKQKGLTQNADNISNAPAMSNDTTTTTN